MNVTFLSNKIKKKKKIYSDPKNEDIVKILWYFVVFLDFFLNIIKSGEPKFTISHTKFILIFSLLEAARALHVQPMLVCEKCMKPLESWSIHTVLRTVAGFRGLHDSIFLLYLVGKKISVRKEFEYKKYKNKLWERKRKQRAKKIESGSYGSGQAL